MRITCCVPSKTALQASIGNATAASIRPSVTRGGCVWFGSQGQDVTPRATAFDVLDDATNNIAGAQGLATEIRTALQFLLFMSAELARSAEQRWEGVGDVCL